MSEEHLSLDVLADLLAGEGDDEAVAHVADCARCSAQLADLDAALVPVATELAALAATALPAPPADLEQRLLGRLRDLDADDTDADDTDADDTDAVEAPVEAAVAPAPRAATPDVVPAPVVPLRPRSTARPRGAGLLGAAAGAVGLLALAGVGLAALGSGGADQGSGAESAGGGGSAAMALPAEVPTSATGNDYGPDSASFTRVLPALLAPGTLAGGTEAMDSAARSAEQAPPSPAGSKLRDGAGSTAGSTAGSGTGAPAAAGAPQTVADDPLARLRDPAELAGCLSALTGTDTDGVPLALDYATFQGRPALVVVLPAARPEQVDVFTVGAGCRAGDDQTLFFTRLPRP